MERYTIDEIYDALACIYDKDSDYYTNTTTRNRLLVTSIQNIGRELNRSQNNKSEEVVEKRIIGFAAPATAAKKGGSNYENKQQ